MNKCYIVAAGDFAEAKFTPASSDYIIAADAGLERLESLSITPNLIVGDYDSLGKVPNGDNVLTFPVEKDDTDTMLAVKEALSMGYKDILIFGGQGGRLDHTLANIQTLLYLKKNGALGVLVGVDEDICIVRNEKIEFSSGAEGTMSLVSLCEKSTGITLENFYYPLTNAMLTNSFPLGVSNKFIGKPASIEVKNGECAVIFTCGVDFLNSRM